MSSRSLRLLTATSALALCLAAHHQAPFDAPPVFRWSLPSRAGDSVPSWEWFAANAPEIADDSRRLKRDTDGRPYVDMDPEAEPSVMTMRF
jgi:hypothetical protein